MVAYRRGLRAKEACEPEWSQVELGRSAALHIRRAKKGKPAVHPIRGDELRMLTTLRKEYPDSGYVFTTEGGPPSRRMPSSAGQDHRPARGPVVPGAFPHAAALLRLQAGQ